MPPFNLKWEGINIIYPLFLANDLEQPHREVTAELPLLSPVYVLSLLSTRRTRPHNEFEYKDMAVCSLWGWGTITPLKGQNNHKIIQ